MSKKIPIGLGAMALALAASVVSADQTLTPFPNGYNWPNADTQSLATVTGNDLNCAVNIAYRDANLDPTAHGAKITTPAALAVKCGVTVAHMNNAVYMAQMYTRYVDQYRLVCLGPDETGYPGLRPGADPASQICYW